MESSDSCHHSYSIFKPSKTSVPLGSAAGGCSGCEVAGNTEGGEVRVMFVEFANLRIVSYKTSCTCSCYACPKVCST